MEKQKGKRRTFSDEFKKEAVKLITVEGYTTRAAAEAVGVDARSIREWRDKFVPEPTPCGAGASPGELREEIKRLRKQLKRVENEREILKKATAYFAKESQ